MSDDYLTVAEAAERIKTSEEMVRRMLREGRLVGKRLGGRRAGWRVAASEVERLLSPEPVQRLQWTAPVLVSDRQSVLVANLLDQAERARTRGDDEGAVQFERMAAEAATASADRVS